MQIDSPGSDSVAPNAGRETDAAWRNRVRKSLDSASAHYLSRPRSGEQRCLDARTKVAPHGKSPQLSGPPLPFTLICDAGLSEKQLPLWRTGSLRSPHGFQDLLFDLCCASSGNLRYGAHSCRPNGRGDPALWHSRARWIFLDGLQKASDDRDTGRAAPLDIAFRRLITRAPGWRFQISLSVGEAHVDRSVS